MFREEERGKRIKHTITPQSCQQSPQTQAYIKLILIICFNSPPQSFLESVKSCKRKYNVVLSLPHFSGEGANSIKDSQKDLLTHILICS